MNTFKAYQKREELNEKMALLLLQQLEIDLGHYIRAIANYPPERMEKYGTPHVKEQELRVQNVKDLIARKFPEA